MNDGRATRHAGPTDGSETPAENAAPLGATRRTKGRARGERPKGSDPRVRHDEHDGALRRHHDHEDDPRTMGPL